MFTFDVEPEPHTDAGVSVIGGQRRGRARTLDTGQWQQWWLRRRSHASASVRHFALVVSRVGLSETGNVDGCRGGHGTTGLGRRLHDARPPVVPFVRGQ